MPFAASALYHELKRRFGAENIFFDGGTLKPGMPFLQEIKAHLNGTAGAFIALIGPRWESIMDAHRRHNDDDYVVREIELGLQNLWTVIPVLLNDAPLPDPVSLPQSIRTLPGYQVAYLRQVSLDDDIEDLCVRLDEIGAQLPQADLPQAASAPEIVAMTEPDEPPTESIEVPDIRPADDEHYQSLVDEADNLVIFLGAGANADDNEGPFQPGAPMLPDDSDLADYLAERPSTSPGSPAAGARGGRAVRPDGPRRAQDAQLGEGDPRGPHRAGAGAPPPGPPAEPGWRNSAWRSSTR